MLKFFQKTHAFTLVELIVVITVIAILSGGASLSITANARNARDTRRKTDLQQIKAALEFYRSNQINSNYPTLNQYRVVGSPNWTFPALVPTYLESMPVDPSSTSSNVINYTYTPSPSGCTNISPSFCTTYTLTANLESGEPYKVTPLSTQ
ncbi:MAG TPA: prepilin-type N-terminal cleavage/methylation domain-containing protein [Candidatus Woesebacteria bacterium]|nr:prepilin-type N-terminal cleavage/methylation domain-containing protein [Candidatus Woesebacteria bacterium]